MPPQKRAPKPAQKPQSERFTEKIRELEAAGELSEDAERTFEKAIKAVISAKPARRDRE